jgi:hypothetical protein
MFAMATNGTTELEKVCLSNGVTHTLSRDIQSQKEHSARLDYPGRESVLIFGRIGCCGARKSGREHFGRKLGKISTSGAAHC